MRIAPLAQHVMPAGLHHACDVALMRGLPEQAECRPAGALAAWFLHATWLDMLFVQPAAAGRGAYSCAAHRVFGMRAWPRQLFCPGVGRRTLNGLHAVPA